MFSSQGVHVRLLILSEYVPAEHGEQTRLLIKEKEIQLPIYIAALDSNDNLIETQFFLIKDNIAMDFENKKLIETDIAKLLNLSFSTDKVISRLIIGFMLDNEKIKLLN